MLRTAGRTRKLFYNRVCRLQCCPACDFNGEFVSKRVLWHELITQWELYLLSGRDTLVVERAQATTTCRKHLGLSGPPITGPPSASAGRTCFFCVLMAARFN
jgi:hypothetical protein